VRVDMGEPGGHVMLRCKLVLLLLFFFFVKMTSFVIMFRLHSYPRPPTPLLWTALERGTASSRAVASCDRGCE
jgi:hypothetical protein